MTDRSWRDAARRYAIATGIVLVAIVVKVILFGEDHPFVLLPGAVALAAWIGGRGPGLLASLLVTATTVYLMLLAPGTTAESTDYVAISALLGESVLVALLTAALRTALRRAQASSAESAAAHRQAEFALAVRDELLTLWTQKLRGPMADIESQARAALADVEQGDTTAARAKLRLLVDEAAMVGRATSGWDEDAKRSAPPAG